jgi:hypothetical protein
MANQNNFQTDLSLSETSNTRFTVSRIVENLSDDILTAELPTVFPSVLDSITVEISIYSLFDNALVYYGVAQNTDEFTPISVNTFKYSDNTIRTLLYINFAELPNFFLPTGKYQVTFNIFSDEIGSTNDRVLKVTRISPSRREIELEHTNPTVNNLNVVKNYITPAITSQWIHQVIKQIFNQPTQNDNQVPVFPSRVTSASVKDNMSGSLKANLERYGFDITSGSYVGTNEITKNVLDKAYLTVSASIATQLTSGSLRFDAETLRSSISSSLSVAYQSVLQDQTENSQKYRYKLL